MILFGAGFKCDYFMLQAQGYSRSGPSLIYTYICVKRYGSIEMNSEANACFRALDQPPFHFKKQSRTRDSPSPHCPYRWHPLPCIITQKGRGYPLQVRRVQPELRMAQAPQILERKRGENGHNAKMSLPLPPKKNPAYAPHYAVRCNAMQW